MPQSFSRDGDNGWRTTQYRARAADTADDGRQVHPRAAEWGEVDFTPCFALICTVAAAQGLCSFGVSSDRGAYRCTVLLDGKRADIYRHNVRDFEDAVASLGVYLLKHGRLE